MEEISILSIPKFLPPNEDSVNDTWNIIGVEMHSFSLNTQNICI